MSDLYQITLPYACGGIVVERDPDSPFTRVVSAAPIFWWMISTLIIDVGYWVHEKGGTIVKCEPEDPAPPAEGGQNRPSRT